MILVECNPDAFIVRMLGFPRKKIRHEGGKGKVFEKVGKSAMATGLVDEDPGSGQPGEIREYESIERYGALTLLAHRTDKSRRIIQVSPYLEHWLIGLAKKHQLSLKEFDLPDNPARLHDIPYVHDMKDFRQFIELLVSKDDEMSRLRDWILQIVDCSC